MTNRNAARQVRRPNAVADQSRRDPAYAQGFVQVPNLVLRDPSLTLGSRLTYCLLLGYAWGDGETWVGQERLASDLSRTVRQLSKYLDELVDRDLVSVTRRGNSRTNLYGINLLRDAYPNGPLASNVRLMSVVGEDREAKPDRKPASGLIGTRVPTTNTQATSKPTPGKRSSCLAKSKSEPVEHVRIHERLGSRMFEIHPRLLKVFRGEWQARFTDQLNSYLRIVDLAALNEHLAMIVEVTADPVEFLDCLDFQCGRGFYGRSVPQVLKKFLIQEAATG